MAIAAAAALGVEQLFAVDSVEDRLALAAGMGARAISTRATNAATQIQDATGGRGADVVVECVGAVAALESALEMVRPGGRISVVGVHSDFVWEMPLNLTFVRGIELKFAGIANILGCWDRAVALLESGAARPEQLITHELPLDDAAEGYRLFAEHEALKVVLRP